MSSLTRGLRRAWVRAKEAVDDWQLAARADLSPVQWHTLQAFAVAPGGDAAEVLDRFQVTTDAVLGPAGHTTAALRLRRYAHFTAGEFSGAIDWRDASPQSRGGFASFRTRSGERLRDLSAFSALEMRVKTDGRPYVLNLKAAHAAPDFLWQIRLLAPAGVWTTLAFPFADMVLTKRGRVELEQHPVERDHIQGWGVLLADSTNGPFRFEVQYLRAVRDLAPEEHVQASEQLIAAAAAGAGSAQVKNTAAAPLLPSASATPTPPPTTPPTPTTPPHGASTMTREALRDFYRAQRDHARLK